MKSMLKYIQCRIKVFGQSKIHFLFHQKKQENTHCFFEVKVNHNNLYMFGISSSQSMALTIWRNIEH